MKELIFFSILLNIDTFSAAFALGYRRFSFRRLLAYAFSSSVAGGTATAIGFICGIASRGYFVISEHIFACSVLVLVGFHMCWEAFHQASSDASESPIPRRLSSLRIFSVSMITSLDNLAIGFTLGVQGKSMIHYALSVGLFAFVFACLGIRLAKSLPAVFGNRLEVLGGVLLVVVGIVSLR